MFIHHTDNSMYIRSYRVVFTTYKATKYNNLSNIQEVGASKIFSSVIISNNNYNNKNSSHSSSNSISYAPTVIKAIITS